MSLCYPLGVDLRGGKCCLNGWVGYQVMSGKVCLSRREREVFQWRFYRTEEDQRIRTRHFLWFKDAHC